MTPESRELLTLGALAFARLAADMRRNGVKPPPSVLAVADFLKDCASPRQEPTDVATLAGVVEALTMTNRALMTKEDAADHLSVSVRTLERILARPDSGLDAVQVEGGIRIRRVDLDAYVSSLSARPFRDEIKEKTA